ncbi:MAG: cytochrome c oxidase subunit 2 [Candidatus Omnitrophota bacterium]|jgi:cytochrome c oxidase subunit 2
MVFLGNFFMPERASTFAPYVDGVYVFIILITVVFTALIYGCLLLFSILYRRKSDADRPKPIEGNHFLEALWIIIPTGIVLVIFITGVALFYRMSSPPADAMEIYATAKQWMWKFQHPEGPREINELHVPVNTNVKISLASEDVLHSFFVPAFRVKNDVVPGRYTQVWFNATKTGRFHLFCAEYCGTDHSRMIGSVVVMEPQDYENWLMGESANAISMVDKGAKIFEESRCVTCHTKVSGALGPDLLDKFGTEETMSNGQKVLFDETYIRESILFPLKKVVQGYQAVMPTYKGQLSEIQISHLIAYIKSLQTKLVEEGDKAIL